MGDKSADWAAMATAAQQIEAKHQQIHTLQERLEGQMVQLSARWHGHASAAFQREYSNFDTEFERVKQDLDKVHTSLIEASHGNLRHGEDLGETAHQAPSFTG